MARLILGLCLSLWLAGAQAGEWSLQTLMAQLAEVKQSRVDFDEERRISLLGVPLRSSGELLYIAPDYLKKIVHKGGQGSYEIDGERLRIEEDQGGEREVTLDAQPALQAFVASFRATLAGDLATLQRYYRVTFDGEAKAWVLTLVPRDKAMARVIREVEIRGKGIHLQQVTTLEQGGDSTVLTIRGDSAP